MLETLARQPPVFSLPKATPTHTRSYLSANSLDPTDKSLIFDGFLAFGKQRSCWITWPDTEMDKQHREVLDRLIRNLSYLGRSESWVEAELTEEAPDGNTSICVALAADGESAGELTRVACVTPPEEYRGRSKWIEALTYSTASLLKEKTSTPPLLQQVSYVCPAGAIETDPPRKYVQRAPNVAEVMLGFHATVLPLVTETLSIAERIRTNLMGAHKRVVGEANVSSLFSGKGADGEKRLDHGHLYILPLSDGNGRINRVLLQSTKGSFTRGELDAVRRVTRLWQADGRGDIRCAVTAEWKRGAFGCTKSIVESATPFVSPRYWRKGRDFRTFLLNEVRKECKHHGVEGQVMDVEPLEKIAGLFHQIEYLCTRKVDPARPSYVVKITFDREVRVPFAIGYGAHFGLGQFG